MVRKGKRGRAFFFFFPLLIIVNRYMVFSDAAKFF